MPQPLKQNTEQEYDSSHLTNMLVTTSEVTNCNSTLINNHHGTNLQMDLRADPKTLIGDIVASSCLPVDANEEEDLLTMNVADNVSTESCTRIDEEYQNRKLFLEENRKTKHNNLLISSSLAKNADKITDLCKIKRPMNAFMLFSNENRGKVCA